MAVTHSALSSAYLLLGLAVVTCVTSEEALVTLPHGGQIRGISTTSQNSKIDVFLAIKYAQAPVGELRFKRPVEIPPWEGISDNTQVGEACPQLVFGEGFELAGNVVGVEDCLVLDVYVPEGVSQAKKKAVMVWIHGGGYTMGTGLGYPGGPLAVIGDVIVVNINYRLGPLGFMSDGPGTGNFGLWDQRAALLWVKKNIAAFGGDPDMVTIFGESAGGGSVSAQTMGLQNDGLFKRAIAQSGALMDPWGFYKSKNEVYKTEKKYRDTLFCPPDENIYDCLRRASVQELLEGYDLMSHVFHPLPDGEFLSDDLYETNCYKPSQRFDFMGGFNGQEGNMMVMFDLPSVTGKNLSDGVDIDTVRQYLEHRCTTHMTKYSPELCADFIIRTYKIDADGLDNRGRLLRLRDFASEFQFNIESVTNLEHHANAAKSDDTVTYAYYFTERYLPKTPLFPLPDWLKTSADHGDEIPFVFGSPYINEAGEPELWKDLAAKEVLLAKFIASAGEKEKPLSLAMMTMWTNFAKTGNPNKPNKIPVEWPEFNLETNHFLEIKDADMRVITTPNKERIDLVRSHLLSARSKQIVLDVPETDDLQKEPSKSGHDEL